MKISRIWAMPDKFTFKIKPIKELLDRYVPNGGQGWVDPFSASSNWAEYTNDINPNTGADFHLESLDFAHQIIPTGIRGILFDPPYSLEQMKRSYESIHRKFTMRDGQIGGRWTELKDELSAKLVHGGLVISFGWNTIGFGKKRDFEIEEILIVCHGSAHNDTLVTVERKL